MCLILTIRVPAASRRALEAAARTVPPDGLHVEIGHAPRWPWAQNCDAEATVSSSSDRRGCACGLLADDADWGSDVWAMRPEALEPLRRTLAALAEEGPEGMTVEALWVGEQPDREQRVTPAELATLAQTSRLGTRTRYVVFRGSI